MFLLASKKTFPKLIYGFKLIILGGGFVSSDMRKKEKSIFEHRREKLISAAAFRVRLAKYILVSMILIAISLCAGMVGYHAFESFSWTDSFLNASMILGGMGPVNELKTEGGKLFAGCYALFSGLIFIMAAGLVFAPLVHRLLHKFHFEDES